MELGLENRQLSRDLRDERGVRIAGRSVRLTYGRRRKDTMQFV
jgi:hypothetical protein